MRINWVDDLSSFPLQLSAVAGVLTALTALLVEVPPLIIIIRTLLAILVFAIFGQILLKIWQNVHNLFPKQASQNTILSEVETRSNTAELSPLTIPKPPSGSAFSSAILPTQLESPKLENRPPSMSQSPSTHLSSTQYQ